MKKKIHIFLRKKNSISHHSIERFASSIANHIKIKNAEIKILKCPLVSEGVFNRFYLIFWAYFNQGDINHIIGDIHFISILLNKKKTINTYLDCRLLHEFKGIAFFLYNLFWFKIPILRSSVLTFISEFTKNDLNKFFNIKYIENHVIPVPLFSENIKINQNKTKSKPYKILIIGTQKHKNFFNMIKSTQGLNVKIYVIGEIDNEVNNYILKNNIKVINYVDVSNNFINNLYYHCDILLMASYYEGFGMPIIEAQYSNLAVITSNLEPMNKICGKNGAVLVNPKKIKDLKMSLLKIINNKKFYKNLIQNGNKNSSKYKKSHINRKYKNIYEELIK